MPIPFSNTQILGDCLSESPKYGINAAAVSIEVSDYPYLRITDIDEKGRLSSGERVGVRDLNADSYLLNENEIVMARTGASVGKTYIKRHRDGVLVYAGFLIKIRTDESKLHSEYLFHYMNSNLFKEWVVLNSTRSGQPGINGKQISSMEIALPNLVEQIAIARALSDVDKLMQAIEQEIVKFDNLFASTIQKVFPSNYLQNHLPTGWELLSLGQLGSITGAGVDKVTRIEDSEISLVNYMDVYKNRFITRDMDFMATTATKEQIGKCSLRKGDVLFTPTSETSDDIARSSVVSTDLINVCYSYHLIRFRAKGILDLNYLAYVFLLEDFRKQALKAAEGSGTRYVVTLPRFRNLRIPVPNLNTQIAIGFALNDIATHVEKLKEELAKYECIKQGMAHDLLTGKVRLV